MTEQIEIYGVTIHNSDTFWDEVKLRAMNNYGDWEAQNIGLAIEDILEDMKETLKNSDQAKQLQKDIESGQY
jgi:hypothetical protein